MPTEWQVIKDFTPGIHQRLSSDYPPGTASPSGTYRCYAVEGGALAPLPAKLTRSITISPPASPASNQASEFRLIGLHLAGPLFYSSEATPGVDENHTEIFIGMEWWVSNTLYTQVARYRRHYLTNPAWEAVWNSSDAGTYSATTRPRNVTFGTTRSNNDNPLQSGPIVIAWVVNGYARFFPDDLDTSVVSTVAMPGDRADAINSPTQLIIPINMVCHQGRVIITPLSLQNFGTGAALTHNESLYWTAFNDLRTLDSTYDAGAGDVPAYFTVSVGPENPTGYGVMASLTANELLMIKARGGAVVIQGDVSGVGPSSPTARTLPYVRSTGLSLCNGTYGPVGYVYPVDGGGAWLWQGGDFSQNLTKHLEADFWRPTPTDLTGTANAWGHGNTQMDSAANWVFFPNNWMWDTDLGGFWRIDDPDDRVIHRWAVDYRNRYAYGTPSGFRDSDDPAVYEYALTVPCNTYSWQSQPLSTTIDKSVQLLDVAVVATGLGQIKVTASTLESPTGIDRMFYSTSTSFPDVQRQSFGIRGTHLTFRIEAEADDLDGTAGAPTIHEIRYSVGVPTPIGG